MPYDFSEMTNRRGTYSMKWDVGENELPLWVADMDFKTAPEITEAIRQKVDTGIYGYTIVPEEYRSAVAGWWQQRHGWRIEKEWIIFCTGVVPAISSIVRKMTKPGDNVIIQPPVYNIFYNSILNNGRRVLGNNLLYDGSGYQMDFEDLESKLSHPQTSLMILCNPHNPIGKIWDKATLARVGEACRRNGVLLLSDEIHCDLTDPGKQYIPFASVSEENAECSVTCVAPTKAFNLAGLQTASVVVPSPEIRKLVDRGLNTDEVAEPNAFAMEATIAAFAKGQPWLDALRGYIRGNKDTTEAFISTHLPALRVVPSEATYLLWLDCTSITENATRLCRHIREKTGLYLSDGAVYGEGGAGFMRMNVACPRLRLQDALDRLKAGAASYRKTN